MKKSGTNELHGMARGSAARASMAHRRYFDRLRTSDPYPGKPDGLPAFFMEPDANIGGPVVIPKLYNGKDKTFFFFGYQRLHEKKYAQVFTSVPTPDMRQGLFNFAGANPIYDPSTTRRLADGTWTRDPFPGNSFRRIESIRLRARSWGSIRGSSPIKPAPRPAPGRPTTSSPTNSREPFLTTTTFESIIRFRPRSSSMAASRRMT